jgi:chromate transporter
MMEEEVVRKRQWMTREHFLDLVGATNLIPGPNSTEMAIHCGYHYAGIPGLIAAGASFILPAALLTTLVAWIYTRFGALPQVEPFVTGIRPAVLAIILSAVFRLGQKAVKSRELALIGGVVIVVALLGISEIVAILAGGVTGMVWLRLRLGSALPISALFPLPLSWNGFSLALGSAATALNGVRNDLIIPLHGLFLSFLKIGAVLFGSGYVLVAYLEDELVHRLGWLTQQELLDAIAAGQFTPGPVLTTSTFVGFLLREIPGAVVATLGIFIPSFLFVAILNPQIPRLRRSAWASAFLDAVNVSAVGIMVAVMIRMGRNILVDWQAWVIALGSAAIVFASPKKVNSAWVVMGGAFVGYLLYLI